MHFRGKVVRTFYVSNAVFVPTKKKKFQKTTYFNCFKFPEYRFFPSDNDDNVIRHSLKALSRGGGGGTVGNSDYGRTVGRFGSSRIIGVLDGIYSILRQF